MKAFLTEFWNDEMGQNVIEYALLLTLIGAAAVFILTIMGNSVGEIFSKINSRLASANQAIT